MNLMHRMLWARRLFLLAVAGIAFGTSSLLQAQQLPDDIDISESPNGIVPLPDTVSTVYTDVFDRYTKIVAPNGQAIHILIQDQVTDEMAVRAREIMRFYITDVPGAQYGADKTPVANRMGDVAATLVYFNSGQAAQQAFNGPLGNVPLFMQDLYATESVVEGSPPYMTNSVRDATLEEVFHLVHGAGIQLTLPPYHAEMTAAKNAAMAAGIYIPPPGLPPSDEVFEYIISVIDVYYGFWAHDPDGDGTSFHGEYAFNTQEAMEAGDPAGVAAMLKFLPGAFSFECSITAGFNGVFTLTSSPATEYTLKSKYLTDVRLTGGTNSGLIGNELDNLLGGNVGSNDIDCQAGTDTVLFAGPLAEYVITGGSSTTVEDTVPDRDGTDVLSECEFLRFSDQTIPTPPGDCDGDANGDGVVDPLDSGFVLARFGCSVGTGDSGCDAADQNEDGAVDPLDSGFVLARFGRCN